MKAQSSDTTPADFNGLLALPTEKGASALIVGGHAVNLWAEYYLQKEPTLHRLGPFVSKDLDLLGDQCTVWELAQRLMQQPRRPEKGEASPILAWFPHQTEAGVATRIDVLFSVYGATAAELESAAAMIGAPQLKAEVRLPNPLSCLKMKVHGAVGLDQRDRQDIKQVQILILCNRAFLRDLVNDCLSGTISERALIKALEAAFTFVTSALAVRAANQFGFDWAAAFPTKDLISAKLNRVKSFIEHRLAPAFPDDISTADILKA